MAYQSLHGERIDGLLIALSAATLFLLVVLRMSGGYGGEEFAVLLPGCTPRDAGRTIERLPAATPSGETCSAGIAAWNGRDEPHGAAPAGRRGAVRRQVRGPRPRAAGAGGMTRRVRRRRRGRGGTR